MRYLAQPMRYPTQPLKYFPPAPSPARKIPRQPGGRLAGRPGSLMGVEHNQHDDYIYASYFNPELLMVNGKG